MQNRLTASDLSSRDGRVVVVILGAMAPVWRPAGYWLDRPADRLRERLANGQCEHCGYDLTGNASGVCPECGRIKP